MQCFFEEAAKSLSKTEIINLKEFIKVNKRLTK